MDINYSEMRSQSIFIKNFYYQKSDDFISVINYLDAIKLLKLLKCQGTRHKEEASEMVQKWSSSVNCVEAF